MASSPPDPRPVVLCYITGLVHVRHLRLLREHLPQVRFLILAEAWIVSGSPGLASALAGEDALVVDPLAADWPERLAALPLRLLFLAMAYPTPFRLRLVWLARQRGLPVMALEEVNQLALNDGMINHYFLPLDYFAVVSAEERERFAAIGFTGREMAVVGWPFAVPPGAGQISGQVAPRCLLALGSLKEKDPVSLETREVRRTLITQAVQACAGMARLLIKPHPIEGAAEIERMRSWAPEAEIIAPETAIEDLLPTVACVINRGNSQVALQALTIGTPLLVLPAGIHTIFHEQLPVVVADEAVAARRLLQRYLDGFRPDGQALLQRHLPLTGAAALVALTGLVGRALNDATEPDWANHAHLAVVAAFCGLPDLALQAAAPLPLAAPLRQLVMGRASVGECAALLDKLEQPLVHWHVQALYARQLVRRPERATAEQVQLLSGFDGRMNPHYFIRDLLARIELEFASGRVEPARALWQSLAPAFGPLEWYRRDFARIAFIYLRPGGSRRLRRFGHFLLHESAGWVKVRLKKVLGKARLT